MDEFKKLQADVLALRTAFKYLATILRKDDPGYGDLFDALLRDTNLEPFEGIEDQDYVAHYKASLEEILKGYPL